MGLKVREFRSLKDRRKYGAISAYWRMGALITKAAGTRADYGSDRLATVSVIERSK